MHSQNYKYTSDDYKYSDYDEIDESTVESVHAYFHYNSDLSGEVWMNVEKFGGHATKSETLGEIKIPGWMLLEFAGRHVNSELQSEIESWSGRETLVAIKRMLG